MPQVHKDVEYAVDDCSGNERVFRSPEEASAFAISCALARGETVNIDVLVWSREGAVAYRGSVDGGEEYDEDPDASVFDRIEIKVNSVGRVS